MKGAPPLRFLVAAVGGWVCLRAAMLAPGWVQEGKEPSPPTPMAASPVPAAAVAVAGSPRGISCPSCDVRPTLIERHSAFQPEIPSLQRAPLLALTNNVRRGEAIGIAGAAAVIPSPRYTPSSVAFPLERPLLPARRWSASAWAFVRRGGDAQLAAGSTLGGSQIGARLGYRINDDGAAPLSIVARAYAPAKRPRGGELSLGLEWQPLPELPVRLLAERRQAIGSDGRSAFAVMAHGGVSRAIGPVLIDGYGQAGIVGARSRDLFVDGSVAVALPLEENARLKIGAALWGAAQPGVSRVDAGPQLTLSLPAQGRNLRLTAEWRLRISGDAAPASGPALTLATEF